MFERRHVLASLLLGSSLLLGGAGAAAFEPIRHFVHGLWFNGDGFDATDFYVEDGRFTHHPSAPDKIETIDLHGQHVVPPYGDAHEHNFNSVSGAPTETAKYLRDGIFYAQGMTDVTSSAAKVVAAALVNTPQTVDVTYAHGGLTAINGHPKEVYESLENGFYYPSTSAQRDTVIASHRDAGDAYWEIDSPADLEAQWQKILSSHPDLIKVFLSGSEDYTSDSHAHPQLGKGLDPKLVPLITAAAHKARLKVAAHVDTAADVHNALVGGVDELGHLPGYGIRAGDDAARYRLSEADIALMVARHVPVQATAGIYTDDTTPRTDKEARQTSQIDNLRRLKNAGVTILIGSDHYGEDSTHEADYLQSLGLWSNVEMLRMWSVSTPKDIFPHRKIAALEPEYEASFLVLSGNPLEDWRASHAIVDRWKQGHRIGSTLEIWSAAHAAADRAKQGETTTPVAERAKAAINSKSVQTDAFIGKQYFPAQPKTLAVLLIGGSEGNLYVADEVGPQLAAAGYVVLGVNYHDGFHGKRALSLVPIETFTHAVAWLLAQPGISRVVVIGSSRGSEAALLTAMYDPRVGGVAAFAPSSVVWGGVRDETTSRQSAWTWAGRPLAFLSVSPDAPSGKAGFQAALAQVEAEKAAAIPVQKIRCPVFLAGSDADAVWPSAFMARAFNAKLLAGPSTPSVKLLTFADASHNLLGPGPKAVRSTWEVRGQTYTMDYGGTAEGTEKARNETWTALLAFLATAERL